MERVLSKTPAVLSEIMAVFPQSPRQKGVKIVKAANVKGRWIRQTLTPIFAGDFPGWEFGQLLQHPVPGFVCLPGLILAIQITQYVHAVTEVFIKKKSNGSKITSRLVESHL